MFVEQAYAASTFYGSQWIYGDFRNSPNFDSRGREGGSSISDYDQKVEVGMNRGKYRQQLAELSGTEDNLSIYFKTALSERALFYTG